MSATKLEFKNSPHDVTVREKLTYTFELETWLGQGDSLDSATARLIDNSTGAEVPSVISDLSTDGSQVTLMVDWGASGILRAREYLLWVKAGIGSQFKEGFARFRTYQL